MADRGKDSNLELGHFECLTCLWSRLIQLQQQIKRQGHQSSACRRLKGKSSSQSVDEEMMDILSEGEIPEEPEAKKLANLQQRALEYVEKLAKYEEVPRSADKEVVEAQLEAYCQSLLQWFQVVRPMMLPWTEPAVPDHASLNTDSKTDHQKPSEQQLFPPRLFEQALKFRETIQICKEVVKLRRTTFEQNKFLDKLQQWTGECEASDKEMESVSSISISSQITARTQKMLDQCQEEIKVSSDQTYAQVGQHLDATMHIVNQVHSLTGGNS